MPFQGALNRFMPTQGNALGYVLVAPPGRALNAGATIEREDL